MAGKLDLKSIGGHATCESLWDTHLVRVPPSRAHRKVSFLQMHAPYDLEGRMGEARPAIEEAMLRDVAQGYAPNMKRDNIVMTHQETPADIEIRLPNMRRGSIKHGDY